MLFRKSACICSLVIKLCLVFIMRLSPTEKNAFSVVPLSFPLLLSCFQFLTFWGRLQSCRMVDEVPRSPSGICLVAQGLSSLRPDAHDLIVTSLKTKLLSRTETARDVLKILSTKAPSDDKQSYEL